MKTQNNKLWDNCFKIQKSNGDTWVYVPSDTSRKLGQTIKKHISSNWDIPEYFYHFKSGGHVEAAKRHLNHRFFAFIDLKQFFTSLSLSRVTRVLKKFWPYEEARILAISSMVKYPDNTTGQSFMIPFGFVQSPIFASLCLDQSHLGTVLNKFFEMPDIKISVYVDDIIISGDNREQLEKFYNCLLTAVEKSGLKTSVIQAPASEITVFNMQLKHQSLQLEEGILSELRSKFKATDNENIQNGIFRYVSSVNQNQTKLLEQQMRKVDDTQCR